MSRNTKFAIVCLVWAILTAVDATILAAGGIKINITPACTQARSIP